MILDDETPCSTAETGHVKFVRGGTFSYATLLIILILSFICEIFILGELNFELLFLLDILIYNLLWQLLYNQGRQNH